MMQWPGKLMHKQHLRTMHDEESYIDPTSEEIERDAQYPTIYLQYETIIGRAY